MSQFSPEALQVFNELLDAYSLPAKHPQFEQVAAAVAVAKRELAAAIAAEGTPSTE